MAEAPGDPLRGIALIVFAIFLFVVMDATAKYLSAYLPVLQIVWARNVFAIGFTLLMLGRRDPVAMLRSRRPGLQFVRSILMFGSTWLFFAAIHVIPLADASSISFVAPLMVTALSVPLLGERVGPRRWAAVVVGFVGAMIIIRPNPATMQLAALLPLGSASCFALYQIATRVLAGQDHAVTTTLYAPVVGAVFCSALMPFLWVSPDPLHWGLLLMVGALGGFSHFVLVKAYEHAPPSLLAPFAYTNLIWSVSLGYMLWGDLPDRWTALGAAIVVASGLYTLYREGVRRRQAARAPTPDP